MRTTPTTENQILAGKIIGIFLTGFFQVGVLVLISSIMFNLRWGNPVSVLLLVMAVVFGATGWGILLAAAARNSYQVASTGSALMLIFGILGGTFIPVSEFSPIIRQFSKITPNYWALQGFTHLAVSNLMGPLIPILIALVIMGFSLFLIAVLFAKRRWADSGFTGL